MNRMPILAACLSLAILGTSAVTTIAAPAYIGRVASTKATPSSKATIVTMTTGRAVAAGDALIVTLELNSTGSGAVTVSDAAGNSYRVDVDQSDGSSGRMLVLSATQVTALASGSSIRVTFPSSGLYMVSVDEFSGIASRDVAKSATGNDRSFNSGSTATTAQPVELLFGAAGNENRWGVTWSSSWTPLSTVSLSGDGTLAMAYRVTSAVGRFSASGATRGTWMAGIVAYTTAAPPDNPPTARLTVNQIASPPLTVKADGSASADNDATPIASYRFDFGDGSTPVTTTAPTAAAQHTYSTSGVYTVSLVVTDTGGHASSPDTASVSVSNQDQPPVARLSVSQVDSPDLTVQADGSASTDNDATPIASYRFDFGDGSTPATTTAPTATAQHTYSAAGSYTVSLVVTDTGGHASSPDTASITVNPTPTTLVAVYAGYYDTHHSANPNIKPNPWRGSPNVIFVGSPDPNTTNGWDTSAIRVDNLFTSSISVTVTVDIGTHHYALWGSQTVPAGGILIVAQTGLENFDGSDTNPAGCYSCDPSLCTSMISHTIPQVHAMVNGVTTTYLDTQQVLNTKGVDGAGCPYTGTRNDESHPWLQIFPTQPGAAAPSRAERVPETAGEARLAMGSPVPNPTTGDFNLRLTVPTRGMVRLGLYDLAGRLVLPCVNGVLDAEEYNLSLHLADRTPGLYFMRLTTTEGTMTRRLVLSR